ncbi:MAG: hypothetical protein ABSD31_08345, partial [Candidatus Binataceae bacterium]
PTTSAGVAAATAPQSTKVASPAPPRAEAEAEDEIVRRLRPVLRQGESLRRCAGCGRVFVAAAADADAARVYCSLAGCQLKARSF